MPKASIILPIYNMEKYLRQCLDSCINQTLKDIEIICVNDGCTDSCPDIIDEYAKKDSRIKIINQQNQGLSMARNNGMTIATGEYILFLDSDDWISLDCCELTYNQAKDNDNDFVYFAHSIYNDNNNKTSDKSAIYGMKPLRKYIKNKKIKPSEIKSNHITCGYVWNKLYKKDFLIQNDINFIVMPFEDYPYTISVLLKAKSMSIIDKSLYFHRIRQNSLSYNVNNWLALINSRDMALEEILSSDNNKNILKAYINRYFLTMLYWYYNYAKINKDIEEPFRKNLINSFKNIIKYDYRAVILIILLKLNAIQMCKIFCKTKKI